MDENNQGNNLLSILYKIYIWFILALISIVANWIVFVGIVQYNDGSLKEIFLGVPALAIFIIGFVFLTLGVFYKKIAPNIRYLLLMIFACALCIERTIQYFPRSLLPKTPFYALLLGMFVLGSALWCASYRTLGREPYTILSISISSVIAGSCVLFMVSMFPYIIIYSPALLVFIAFVLVATFWACKIWIRQEPSVKKRLSKQFFPFILFYFFWLCSFFYLLYKTYSIFPSLQFPLKSLVFVLAILSFTPAVFFVFGNFLSFHKAAGISSDIFPYRKNILQFFGFLILVLSGVRIFYLSAYPSFPWELKKILGPGHSQTLFLNPTLGFSLKKNNTLSMTEDAGIHWREVHLEDFSAHRMRFFGEKTCLLLGKENNKIAYTSDGGKNWDIKTIKGFRPYQVQEKKVQEIEKPLNTIEYPPIEAEKNSSYLPVFWTDAALLSSRIWIVIGHEYSNTPEDIYFGMEKVEWKESSPEEGEEKQKIEKYTPFYISFIMKTEDAGDNWQILKKGTGILKNISCPSWGLIAGDPVLVSNSKGETWKKLPIPTDTFDRVHVVKESVALAIRKNTLFLTKDDGKSWQSLYETSRKDFSLSIHDFFSKDAQAFFIASQDILPKEKYEHNYRFHSVVLYSPDQGKTWKKETVPLTARIHNFFFMRDRLSLTAESPYGTILYSRAESHE